MYAIELAKRLDLPVGFLMLVSNESNISEEENALSKKLMRSLEQAQIEATSETRHGDKATEFLKYMAADSNPAAIIWGSDRHRVDNRGTGKSTHWLNRLSNLLPCSIVSPIPKNEGKN